MSEQIRILIMTPSFEVREGLSKLLKIDDAFMVVGTARTALEGLERTEKLQPDIVITGMSQTDMPGLTFIRQLKERFPSLGVIVVSLADKPQTIQAAYTAGADAYIVKPVNFAELETTIQQTAAQIRAGTTSLEERDHVPVLEAATPSFKVFVSYSRTEWDEFVEPLVMTVGDSGFNVWVDQHLLHGGDFWFDKINEALRTSDILVLCLSPAALESRFVKMEYRYFFLRDKPIVPVMCQPVEDLPAELMVIQYQPYDLDLLVTQLTSLQQYK